MTRKVTKGNPATLLWYFANRQLTTLELEAFFGEEGLPAGVGVDPVKSALETTPEGGSAVTTEVGVSRDGPGEYRAVTIQEQEGNLLWRGVGLDAEGNIIAATGYETLEVEGLRTGRVAAMVDAVMNEGNFDITEAQALRWLTRAHRRMCSRANCIRRRIDIGPADDRDSYDLPAEVVQLREVLVGGEPYGTGIHADVAVGQYLLIDGPGVTAEDATPGGAAQLVLIPAPAPGVSIQVFAYCRAEPLVVGDDTTLGIPEEFDQDVIAGAVAWGLQFEAMRPDLAPEFWTQFNEGCTELLKSTRRRFRGPGPTQIRVQGLNV